MKKIRFASLLLSFIMLLPFALSACESEPAETTSAPEKAETPAVTDEATTEEATTAIEETTAAEEIKEFPKSLKILAIGNSFSTDSMQYLYQIMKDGGVEEIVLGNLYYGGCSLDQHMSFAKADSASYKYYKNTTNYISTIFYDCKLLKDKNFTILCQNYGYLADLNHVLLKF
jgi:hypothetical protein